VSLTKHADHILLELATQRVMLSLGEANAMSDMLIQFPASPIQHIHRITLTKQDDGVLLSLGDAEAFLQDTDVQQLREDIRARLLGHGVSENYSQTVHPVQKIRHPHLYETRNGASDECYPY